MLKFKESKVDANYPELLLIDEPEQQLMPRKKYLKIMALLKELTESYKDSIQIIIAAAEIPPALKYIKFI